MQSNNTIPSSQRPDGSWRKPVKVRRGYGIVEENSRYIPPSYYGKRGREKHKAAPKDEDLDVNRLKTKRTTQRALADLEMEIQREHAFYILLGSNMSLTSIKTDELTWEKNEDDHVPDYLRIFLSKASPQWIGKLSLDMELDPNTPDQLIAALDILSSRYPSISLLLVCAPSLSKQHRATLHHRAQDLRMASQSFGTGGDRFLVISTTEEDLVTPSQMTLSLSQELQAVQLWKWAQADQSGKYSSHSLGEVKEMVYHGTLRNHPLMNLRSEMVTLYEFHQACKQADIDKVAEILSKEKSVVWKRHPESEEVSLVEACKSGEAEVVEMLLQAGADPNAFSRQEGLTVSEICKEKGFVHLNKILSEFSSVTHAHRLSTESLPNTKGKVNK